MEKASCNIIRDVLPLYHDQVCSEDTVKMVEEHLQECSSCKQELERIQDNITAPEDISENRKDSHVIRTISASWKRLRIRSFIKGGVIGALVISLLVLSYFGLFEWHIMSVPTDRVEINEVSELPDGKMVYFAEINDGYSLNRIKYHMDREGNFYITPLRPVIKQEADKHLPGLEKGYDFIDMEEQELVRGKEIATINYGTPKDHIMIWEKGMDLPDASEEIQNMFNF
ncbi:zf-HC2 domain-containing protein [Bacillus sp. H-16]|uniref:zf-HC2 domain-containing protein n=1 Tax=Alteribacter salitolerans TaxID=2912333 RepID=UPI0019664266|nr:zf-HC2 domain-containing protein [Alteribacter salitolerans]